MRDLAKQFDGAMFEIYRRAKLEADYNATIFLRMVSDRGGLATASVAVGWLGSAEWASIAYFIYPRGEIGQQLIVNDFAAVG
jgi:hypothetical protein